MNFTMYDIIGDILAAILGALSGIFFIEYADTPRPKLFVAMSQILFVLFLWVAWSVFGLRL